MFETLFGSGMPFAARFFIAFLVVLGSIGLIAWLVRRFGANRLGGGTTRGRQPRLAVIDAAPVDGRRRLVLIRRDNIEHLLMIGGPSDIVVESNIVRAPPVRDTGRISNGPEISTRGTPVVDNSGWPLQPSSESPAPAAAQHLYRGSAMEEPWLAPEPGARPRPVETAGFASDLGTPPREIGARAPTSPTSAQPVSTHSNTVSQPDHNIAEIAFQLESALRRNTPDGHPQPPAQNLKAGQTSSPHHKPDEVYASIREFKPHIETKAKTETKFEPKIGLEPKSEARPEFGAEVRPQPRLEPSASPASKIYDSLEEEMASLLGRPSGKS